MVMAQSLFKRLKDKWPDTSLDVLAPAWTLPLVERMPEVRRGLEMPIGHGQLSLGLRYRLARGLRASYQRALVLPNSFKSALIPWLARIPHRTGFLGELRYGLLNDARRLNPEQLPTMTERFVSLAEEPGVYPEQRPWPRLSISPAARDRALEKLELCLNKPVLALCPGAEYGPAKRWPTQHFARVAEYAGSRGWQVWLFGSARDLPVTEEIIALADVPLKNLAGRTSLGEACDLLSVCVAVVTNDSGLMHVGAALDRPLVCVYGSSDPGFTPPLSDKAMILQLSLECSPCFERTCRFGHYRCLRDLQPAPVIAALEGIHP